MTEHLMQCEEALRLLAVYLDGELEGTSQADLERHLDTCRSCYSRAEFERRLRAQLAHVGKREPGAAFAARMKALLREFTGGTDAPESGS